MSAAMASRAVSGGPSCQRLRSVAMTDVLRYWLVTTFSRRDPRGDRDGRHADSGPVEAEIHLAWC